MLGLIAPTLGAVLLAVTAGASEAPAAEAPRVIVLISIDTLRRDALEAGLTPALARFARQGAVFENAFTQATWTLPSHASMLTSRYPSSHGAGGTGGDSAKDWRPIAPDAVSLASLLKRKGYRTVGLVSSPVLDASWGFSRGFDEYGRAEGKPGEGEPTFEAAARRLARAGPEPLFIFIHSNIVHGYLRQKSPPAEGAPFECPITSADFLPEFNRLPVPDGPRSPECAIDRRAYDRAIVCMDRSFGKFLDALDQTEAGKDALVIFTSDHGELLCEEHPQVPLRGHGYPGYSSLIDVPLIVRWPRAARAGDRVASSAREIDIAPTVLDAAGAAPPAGFRGRSLLPLLRGRPLPEAPSCSEDDNWKAVRRGRYNFIWRGEGAEELYDVAADPRETVNLAMREKDAVRELKAFLDKASNHAKPAKPRARAVDERIQKALKAEGYVP